MGRTKYWWQWITSAPRSSRARPGEKGSFRASVQLRRITRSKRGAGRSRSARGPKLTSLTSAQVARAAMARASSSAKRSPPPSTDSGAK